MDTTGNIGNIVETAINVVAGEVVPDLDNWAPDGWQAEALALAGEILEVGRGETEEKRARPGA